MTANNAKALLAKLQSDQNLAKEFKNSKDESDFLAKAKKHGFEVSIEEFKKATEELKKSHAKSGQLSDDELEKVAGGLSLVGVDYAFVGVQTSKK
jgi:predicted ribosomally synthesized peptide with nif11-like leader